MEQVYRWEAFILAVSTMIVVMAGPVASAPDQRTRFVVALEREVEFAIIALRDPHRVVIELPDIRLALPHQPDNPKGMVKSFRVGLAAPNKARIVIDVILPVVVEHAVIKQINGKYQLIVDLASVDAGVAGSKHIQGRRARIVPMPRPTRPLSEWEKLRTPEERRAQARALWELCQTNSLPMSDTERRARERGVLTPGLLANIREIDEKICQGAKRESEMSDTDIVRQPRSGLPR